MIADPSKELDALSRMTAEQMAMPFPPGFRGLDVDHQDLVMPDADAHGYAASALEGPLSEQHRTGLTHMRRVNAGDHAQPHRRRFARPATR
ncbi:hypothetical protein [Streptomyces griseoruber]|uniref:Uncharacterized protein n=1 Tax=Streptomyces griseoruber TaxID=1943 RepID=A0A101T2N9_9ACTN|nr:hypothetical protein [Streptomyces griseoruber]KUN84619.1 hypothetical protein AQJ64_14020 [Streptomyces griseoruber]